MKLNRTINFINNNFFEVVTTKECHSVACTKCWRFSEKLRDIKHKRNCEVKMVLKELGEAKK